MKFFTAAILLISTLLITSWALLKETDFSSIKIGMTSEQVKERIGKPARVVAAKRYADGILEVYEYPRLKARPDTMLNWLYFIDNKLEEWGPKEQYIPNDYDRYYNKYRRDRR